jgi:hypothetical protein
MAVPLVFHGTAASVEALARCLAALEIDEARMRAATADADVTTVLEASARLVAAVVSEFEAIEDRS